MSTAALRRAPALVLWCVAVVCAAAPFEAIEGDWQALTGEWQDAGGSPSALTWSTTTDGTRAELPSDLLFDFDSATLRPQAEATLAELAQGIRQRDPRRVRIEGHTDAKGSDRYNQKLSERRAQSVRQHLAQVQRIDPASLSSKGFGETRPVAPNVRPDGSDNPEGRQRNRRVEVVLESR